MSDPIVHDSGERSYVNWHQNFDEPLRRLVDVWNGDASRSTLTGYGETTAALQRLIGESLAVAEQVRGLGGTWSFSKAAVSEGTLVNTKPLNYKFHLSDSALSARFTGRRDHLYFVQCGNSVAELNWYLFDEGRSLPTTGASNGQTIAGALSTNTHGAALDFGSVPDFVVALHLVVSPDRHVWLERASNPVVQDSRLPDRIDAEVIRDDALFDAALVGFGSFGLLHGVVIEAMGKYFLNAFRRTIPLDDDLRATLDDLDFSRLDMPRPGDRPWHFQVIVNPFEPSQASVTTMYRDDAMPPDASLPDPPSKITQGDDALGIVGVLTDVFGDITPALSRGLVSLGYADFENKAGTPGQMFRDTTTRGRASSTALAIPLERVSEVLDAVLQLHEEVEAPVVLACRYVKSTPATLGFTSFGERCCVFEIDGPTSAKVRSMHTRTWALLRDLGVPFRFHWGKLHDLTGDTVRQAYGQERIEAWLAARRLLLDSPELRRTFSNEMLSRMQLHT